MVPIELTYLPAVNDVDLSGNQLVTEEESTLCPIGAQNYKFEDSENGLYCLTCGRGLYGTRRQIKINNELQEENACAPCPQGYDCPGNSSVKEVCSAGFFCPGGTAPFACGGAGLAFSIGSLGTRATTILSSTALLASFASGSSSARKSILGTLRYFAFCTKAPSQTPRYIGAMIVI